MAMTKLTVLDNRFQTDVWVQALEAEGIAFRLRTYADTAYDGLFVSQKGYGALFVEEEDLARAREIEQALSEPMLPDAASPEGLARYLDHTLLAPEAGMEELEAFLEQCLDMQCAAACVSPWMVERAAQALAGSRVAVCGVVGFPLGTATARSKLQEALDLAAVGATELDMVLNRGLVFSGQLQRAVDEAAEIAQAIRPAMLKVILETGELGPVHTAAAAQALAVSGAAFLKTGSGYFGPATLEGVALLMDNGGGLAVKAAGGIKTLDAALTFIEAGAARLGTSGGWQIYQEALERWPDAD